MYTHVRMCIYIYIYMYVYVLWGSSEPFAVLARQGTRASTHTGGASWEVARRCRSCVCPGIRRRGAGAVLFVVLWFAVSM